MWFGMMGYVMKHAREAYEDSHIEGIQYLLKKIEGGRRMLKINSKNLSLHYLSVRHGSAYSLAIERVAGKV